MHFLPLITRTCSSGWVIRSLSAPHHGTGEGAGKWLRPWLVAHAPKAWLNFHQLMWVASLQLDLHPWKCQEALDGKHGGVAAGMPVAIGTLCR